MFEKVNVPILGIIENMALHICSKCNNEEHIFGKDGGVRMSKDYNVDLNNNPLADNTDRGVSVHARRQSPLGRASEYPRADLRERREQSRRLLGLIIQRKCDVDDTRDERLISRLQGD